MGYDGHALPFADGGFDAVIIWAQTFGLLYGDACKQEFLSECHRVLKPGGLISFSGHDDLYLTANYPAYTADRRFHPYADTSIYWETFTPNGLSDHARTAGFHALLCDQGAIYKPEDGTILHCLARKPM